MRRLQFLLALFLAAATGRSALAQPLTPPPQFEVASIKPHDPNVAFIMGVKLYPGGRVVIPGVNLKSLIITAFDVSYWQISGGEPWMEKENYDLEAKPAADLQPPVADLHYTWTQISDPRLRQMLQALLIDRFQLKFHRETRTGTVYLLQTSSKPLVLRKTASDEDHAKTEGDAGFSGNLGYAGGQWNIYNSTLPQIAKWASDYVLRAPVLDQTGIPGAFDYRQKVPDTGPDANYSDSTDSFLRFINETGLKLERTKGPVETFVIDSAARPSSN